MVRSGNRPRVMIVDDQPECVRAIARLLELRGYSVAGFECPRVAFDAFKKHPFDLVISDIEMPGLNGLLLVDLIRKLRPGFPVIVMSALADRRIETQALEAGADAFVAKQEGALAVCRAAERLVADLVGDGSG